MTGVYSKKIRATELRKEGKSYREIAQSLSVQKSTVAYYFKGLDWSRDIKDQLTEKAQKVSRDRLIRLNNLKKIKWAKFYDKAEKEAITDFDKLKNNPLFIAGVMIYWGEGTKNEKSGVKIANTDPKMLAVFHKFLINICKVDQVRVRAWLLLYPDLNQDLCLAFWSEHVNISENNFYKSTIIPGRHKSRRLGNGVCTLIVSSFYLQKKMLKWIELCADQHIAGVAQW